MTAQASQGSLWRRWDPHLHLPGTRLNDQFGNLDIGDALDLIATREPAIEAIGVTDYLTTSSFRRALAAWSTGRGSGIKLLFPNVEVRLDIPTSHGSGVNLHFLCAPEEVNELDRFLGGLEFSWRSRPYRADEVGLMQLGRDFRNAPQLDDMSALREGTNQFKVTFESLRSRYEADAWARKRCLIAVAGSQSDGTSGLQTPSSAFAARRQSIERLAHIIFSANPQQQDFWVGLGAASAEELIRVYGGPKLCLHGSDAHDAAGLGMPDLERFTWLKGDTSFDTLRMACLAPGSRAQISSISPAVGFGHGRIASVSLQDGTWFSDGRLLLNPGLVAIIGARGSGKTALADIIAAAAGSNEPFLNSASFIRRAGGLLKASTAEVEWTDGQRTRRKLDDRHDEPEGERGVRYLSQQFVERLCAADGVSDALLTEIERVVFNAWPVEQRQGATNFNEFLDIRLESARARRRTEIEAISDLGEGIADQRALLESVPTRREELKTVEGSLERFQKETTEITSLAQAGNAQRLALVSAALEKQQDLHQAIERRITAIQALQTEVALARSTRFSRYVASLRDKYSASQLSDADWLTFRVDFVGNVDGLLGDLLSTAQIERSRVAGSKEDGAQPLDHCDESGLAQCSIAELASERARLQQLVGLDEQRSKRLTWLNSQAADHRTKAARLRVAIEKGDAAGERISELTEDRLSRYAAYFDALLEEETELRLLYAPLERLLANFGASVARLRFSVRRSVDLQTWASAGEQLLDLRKTGAFRGAGELSRIASEELLSAWRNGTASEAADAVRQFSKKHSKDLREQSAASPEDSEGYRAWERAVSSWLYGAYHVTLTYSLEYDGLNVERLSPGTRGIVLLLLYLAVDQEETDPLIIDQPEENLDPESVYTELVDLFRSASRRRQIIMITHNANLVVNTDVDQVIVAHCGSLEEGRLPVLNYQLGGLEEPHIRSAVCEVLEGGTEAFLERARRLGLEFSGVVDSEAST